MKKTKESRLAHRTSEINYIQSQSHYSNVSVETYKDIVFVTWVQKIRGIDKPCMKAWKGTQATPYINYFYSSIDVLSEAIRVEKKFADSRENFKKKVKKEKSEYVHDLKVGDILDSSWGYEQTNVDFYQVVDTFGKKGVVLRKIKSKLIEETGMDQGIMEACPNEFCGDAMRKTVRVGGSVRIDSVSRAYKSTGKRWASWYY